MHHDFLGPYILDMQIGHQSIQRKQYSGAAVAADMAPSIVDSRHSVQSPQTEQPLCTSPPLRAFLILEATNMQDKAEKAAWHPGPGKGRAQHAEKLENNSIEATNSRIESKTCTDTNIGNVSCKKHSLCKLMFLALALVHSANT
ncbi:hypothetical protein [Comamonas testosteroni]|uniref:hypothetical protein n=2 Tax=Comamonas testosteroni TaxID=285 RepID=UPI0005536D7E|nr:hypothetical protein [Comamonas testosteroni]